MYIQLTDQTLSAQKEAAITAFRKGELETSQALFEGILAHWPLDATAAAYLNSIEELLSWGVDPSFLRGHWERIEALMTAQIPGLCEPTGSPSAPPNPQQTPTGPLADSFSSLPGLPEALPQELRPDAPFPSQARHTPPPLSHVWQSSSPTQQTIRQWPKELQIAFGLLQSGKVKEAQMWVNSYLEILPTLEEVEELLDRLPAQLLAGIPRTTTHTQLEELFHVDAPLSPHDSTPPPFTQSNQAITPAQVTERHLSWWHTLWGWSLLGTAGLLLGAFAAWLAS